MQLKSFRITNFRSVIDSGWIELSPDGVTVLVGQNESGKTSVLQGLHCVLARRPITPDDKRIDAKDPEIFLRGHINWDELEEDLEGCDAAEVLGLKQFVKAANGSIDLKCEWSPKAVATALTEFHCAIANSK